MTTPEGHDTTRTAGIVTRTIAAVIDVVVVLLVLAVLYLGWLFVTLAFSPRAFSFPAPHLVFSSMTFLVVAIAYLVACWTVSGCTVGAVVMGVEVVGQRVRRISPITALLRATACVVFPIGLAWVALDRERRSVQDIALRTKVVYRTD